MSTNIKRSGVVGNALRWVLCVLLSGWTVGLLVSAPPAYASCAEHVTNINGDDYANPNMHGNGADTLVTSPAQNDNGIVHSFFIGLPDGDLIEVGWLEGTDWGTGDKPWLFVWWKNNGVPRSGGPKLLANLNAYVGTTVHVNVVDENGNHVFSVYLDTGSGPVLEGTTPTMSQNYGLGSTNTERHCNADNMWAHYINLHFYNQGWQPYDHLTCVTNLTNDWDFVHDSATEHHVLAGNGSC